MTSDSFILVFRPHQRPAWARSFENESHFVQEWLGGAFDASCFANNDIEVSDEPTYGEAESDVGHDLHQLTRLDSKEEVANYLADRDYGGSHNKGRDAVAACAIEIGWIEEDVEA